MQLEYPHPGEQQRREQGRHREVPWTHGEQDDRRDDREQPGRIRRNGRVQVKPQDVLDARGHAAERTRDPGQLSERAREAGVTGHDGQKRTRSEEHRRGSPQIAGIELERSADTEP